MEELFLLVHRLGLWSSWFRTKLTWWGESFHQVAMDDLQVVGSVKILTTRITTRGQPAWSHTCRSKIYGRLWLAEKPHFLTVTRLYGNERLKLGRLCSQSRQVSRKKSWSTSGVQTHQRQHATPLQHCSRRRIRWDYSCLRMS